MRLFYLLATLIIILTGASMFVFGNGAFILEYKDSILRITDSLEGKRQRIAVSGLSMDSGACVESLNIIRSGRRMIVRVFLRPAKGQPPCGNSFRGAFFVPADVSELWFGTPPDTAYVGHLLIGRLSLPRVLHDWFSGYGGAVIWRRSR